ncbi:hypothetical protein [Pseudorhodoferax sp. Leaf267]|uniref:hypothetical protein n=1 Tax=Pseudorhodoferax sp. Leaf267 TaxID=1736316 RepID=UPI0012E159CC|nr:hypothetical protein [Pseudorhodoferax sp. Leaf267]
MKQIRIASNKELPQVRGEYFCSEWMAASSMNLWMLKARLVHALAQHGPESHWIEAREAGLHEKVAEAASAESPSLDTVRPLIPYSGRARAIS